MIQINRYIRQEIFIGTRNQKKLRKSLVAVVGCGATGSAAAEYLARAGVNLRLIDRDIVELTNIQRQLYREEDTGKPKAGALKERLEEANSEVKIESFSEELDASGIGRLLSGVSLVLDGTDNMDTRFLINDFCMKNRLPFTYAAAIKSEALFTLIVPGETACLRCFIRSPAATDTCETVGVLGPAAAVAGVISAMEAIKHLLGKNTIKNSLLHINFYKNIYELLEMRKSRDCPVCDGVYEFLDKPRKQVVQLCGGTFQFIFEKDISISGLAEKLEKNSDYKIITSGKNFARISHKNCIISLFRNRMIVQKAKSEKRHPLTEKDVRIIAAKMFGM